MRLPKIEALDLRRARPESMPREPRPCGDCGRLTRAGELCCRCQIVDEVARHFGVTRERVWWALVALGDDCPPAAGLLVDEAELRQLAARLEVEG